MSNSRDGTGGNERPDWRTPNGMYQKRLPGKNGGAPTWKMMIQLWETVAGAKALGGKLGYVTTPGVVSKMLRTVP